MLELMQDNKDIDFNYGHGLWVMCTLTLKED